MKHLILVAAAMVVFSFFTYAQTTPTADQIAEKQLEQAGGSELSGAGQPAQEFDKGFDYMDTAKDLMKGEGKTPQSILSRFFSLLFREVSDSMGTCLKIILTALCLCAMSNFLPEKEKILDVAFYVCYMVIFIMCMDSFSSAVQVGKKAIESMDFFMKASVPVFSGLMAASGGVARVGIVSLSILGISAAVGVISGFIFPASMFAAILSGVNHLSTDFSLKGLSVILKKSAVWCLGLVMTIFAGVMATQSFAAVHLDNVTSKTIKFAAGSFIPVVGGVLSDTLEGVLACGKLVKGAAGGAGVIAVLYICLSPVVKLLAIILTYKIAAVVISPVADKRISEAVEEFSGALTMILALVISVGAMFMVCAGLIAAI